MKISLVGLGSLGRTIALLAHNQGHSIQGYLKDKTLVETAFIVDCENETHSVNLICNDLLYLTHSELVIVTVKAFNVIDVMKFLDKHLSNDTLIVLINNGMGTKELIERFFPTRLHQIIQVVTTMAAYSQKHKTRCISLGKTYYGSLFPKALSAKEIEQIKNKLLSLSQIFSANNPQMIQNASWVDNIIPYQLEKLYFNAIINPLTVKYECLNGELVHHQAEIQALSEEIYHLNELMLKNNSGLRLDKSQFYESLYHIIQVTGSNRSSMLQDHQAGRRTEIEFITGYLLLSAELLNVELPKHKALYEFVKQLDDNS